MAEDKLPFIWNPIFMAGGSRHEGDAPAPPGWMEHEFESRQMSDVGSSSKDFVTSMTTEHGHIKKMLKGLMPNATENKINEVAMQMAYDSVKSHRESESAPKSGSRRVLKSPTKLCYLILPP